VRRRQSGCTDLFPCMTSVNGTHTAGPTVLCLDVGGPWGLSACCGGDLVSKGSEKPNGWSQASFEWNEGEKTRCFDKSAPTGTGKQAQGSRSRSRKQAERGAGPAVRSLGGAESYQQFSR